MSVPTRREHNAMQSARPKLSGRRLWLIRLLMVAVSSLVGLFLADKIVGLVRHTAERHRLRLAPNLSFRHRSSEFDYVFHSNSRGLRGPEIPLKAPADTYRIAVLGDSFVAGLGVADGDVLTVRLAEALSATAAKPIEVINLGRVGTSTIRELDVYETLGRPYHPDVVVLMFYAGNDLLEVVEERDREETRNWRPQGIVRRVAYALFPNLYLELAIWKQHRETIRRLGRRSEQELLAVLDRMTRRYGGDFEEAKRRYLSLPQETRTALERGLLDDWRVLSPCYDPTRLQRSLYPDDRYFNLAWPRVRRHLELLRQAVAADGGKLVVATIPDAVQIDRKAYQFAASLGYHVEPQWLNEESRTQQALRGWAEKAGVPYLDLTDEFRRSAEPLYFPKDGHFNPAGQAKAAQVLAEFLSTNGLLPARQP
jgi:lysophospholipase L1-like esterase